MGCFLGCFGSSKDDKKRIKDPQFRNRDVKNQFNSVCDNPNLIVNQKILTIPLDLPIPESCIKQKEIDQLNLEIKDKPQEQAEQQASSGSQKRVTFDSTVKGPKPPEQVSSVERKKVTFDSTVKENNKPQGQVSLGTRRKVTFDSNVKEYEHVSFNEPPEIEQEIEKGVEEVHDNCIKPTKTSSSEGGSSLSSLGSFPPNHRYQNCRESDDEDDELVCEVSDLDEDDDDEDEEDVFDDEYSDDEYHLRQFQDFPNVSCPSVESRTESSATSLLDDGYNDHHMLYHGSLARESKTPVMFNRGARDRAGYVHSVLNPVENTAQWKSVKVKGTPPMKEQKENHVVDLDFQHSSTKPKPSLGEPKNNNEVAVNASLSTWLISSLKSPPTKDTANGLEPISSAISVSSHGSNSVISQEERPILGTLTFEELKEFSATSSPRRSPSLSPNERPLVGTVGVHWNDRTPVVNHGSVSSFKGIPNTTSKYREDQRVNWHSTPFEARLERALNRDGVEGHASRRAC